MPHFPWAGGDRRPYCSSQHDEIIIEARDGIEDQVREIVKESMEEAFKRIIPEVPFVVEPKNADSWRRYAENNTGSPHAPDICRISTYEMKMDATFSPCGVKI